MSQILLSLDDFLPYRLSVASNLVSGRIAQAYESLFGLSIPEWRLIAVIAERPHVTQQAIGSATGMDKVTVSRAAASLVGRGLIAREANRHDRRSHLLSLTPIGWRLYAEVVPKAKEMEAAIFAALTDAERNQLRSLLLRVEAAIAASDPGA